MLPLCHPIPITGVETGLSVEDDGCGMDLETQSKIFDPFFTTKEVGKGSGMGLAYVYGICQLLNWQLQFTTQPGATEFFIKIPHKYKSFVIIYFPKAHQHIFGTCCEESSL